MNTRIRLLNSSIFTDRNFIRTVQRSERAFGCPVKIERGTFDIRPAFDSSRGQYNSTVLLAQILLQNIHADEKVIAIVDVDLHIPVLSFVFGEAQLEGAAAIVSTYRLSNLFYGLPHNDALLFARLEKEIIHELGHTFGLYHCRHYDCVMRSSTYVEEIDLKSVEMCRTCRSLLIHDEVRIRIAATG